MWELAKVQVYGLRPFGTIFVSLLPKTTNQDLLMTVVCYRANLLLLSCKSKVCILTFRTRIGVPVGWHQTVFVTLLLGMQVIWISRALMRP